MKRIMKMKIGLGADNIIYSRLVKGNYTAYNLQCALGKIQMLGRIYLWFFLKEFSERSFSLDWEIEV